MEQAAAAVAMVEGTNSDSDIPPLQERRRSICQGCDRPIPVCLCHVIPNPPIPTATRIIIQQPVRVWPQANRQIAIQCDLRSHSSPQTSSAVSSSAGFYLFPPTPSSPESVSLSDLRQSLAEISSVGETRIVIAFDATWKHAKEMVTASEGYLSKFARRACLDGFDSRVEGRNIYESLLVLRKEPCGGCVSTLEAVARWVGAAEVEGDRKEADLGC